MTRFYSVSDEAAVCFFLFSSVYVVIWAHKMSIYIPVDLLLFETMSVCIETLIAAAPYLLIA